jgi:hypothetical protein
MNLTRKLSLLFLMVFNPVCVLGDELICMIN